MPLDRAWTGGPVQLFGPLTDWKRRPLVAKDTAEIEKKTDKKNVYD